MNEQEEQTIWQGRSSQAMNLWVFVVCGLTCWLIFPLFIALSRWLQVRFRTYELSSERLHISHGVFSRQTDDIELYRVKDLTVLEPFFLRLFGCGNVLLHTSDRSTPTLVIQSVDDPKHLRDLIRAQVEACRDKKRVGELDID